MAMTGMNTTLWRLFNLRRDQDDPATIDADIRAGTQPVGANLWVLFFAILIASVGLNVNSTAVIVGAMLVSPLMGPVLAVGYGAAIHDLKLIRQGSQTLLIFTVLSVLTSTLYFTLSPLEQVGTELLARASPTLWDVLVATFGGAAGMIAATRKDISNVLPGVAIATALMPPLCTVGFGLAHGRWEMVGGATYLFLINGVFIAAATLGISKVLRLPRLGRMDTAMVFSHRVIIVVGISAVLAPSIWLGYRLVQHEVFVNGSLRVVQALQASPQFNVVAHQIDADARTVQVTLVGGFDEARLQELALALLRQQGLADAKLVLRRAGDAPVDVNLLRSQLKQDVNNTLVEQLQMTEAKLKAMDASLTDVRQRQNLAEQASQTDQATKVDVLRLRDEIRAQRPQVQSVSLAFGSTAQPQATTAQDMAVVVLTLNKPMTTADKT
jgi:uncharacterized hydrophobic protein (TIGR00271 family)